MKKRCNKTRRHLIRGEGKVFKCPSELEIRCRERDKVVLKGVRWVGKISRKLRLPPRRRKSFPSGTAMAGDEGVLVLYLNVLRWLGLSLTRIRRSPRGDFVASDSRFHLLVNLAVAGVFALAFCYINPVAFTHTAQVKTPTTIYLLYTKLMTLTIVVLSFCGNLYNRKFVSIINLFCRVKRQLERDFGQLGRGKNTAGCGVLLGFFVYFVASTALSLWTDSHLTVHYERAFRTLHLLCYSYVIFFTAHFAITMNYMRVMFKRVNALFEKIVAPERCQQGLCAPPTRKKLGTWLVALVDLQEAEGLANEIFGKQIFLTMILAFSRVIVNTYYLVTLNLNGTSTSQLNTILWLGLFQAVTGPLINTMAAELTANEANRINKIIFHAPLHLHNWEMFNQVQYFTLFSHCHLVEFKVWIFYAINYASLLKVILTSSAITVIILQCDSLKVQVDI